MNKRYTYVCACVSNNSDFLFVAALASSLNFPPPSTLWSTPTNIRSCTQPNFLTPDSNVPKSSFSSTHNRYFNNIANNLDTFHSSEHKNKRFGFTEDQKNFFHGSDIDFSTNFSFSSKSMSSNTDIASFCSPVISKRFQMFENSGNQSQSHDHIDSALINNRVLDTSDLSNCLYGNKSNITGNDSGYMSGSFSFLSQSEKSQLSSSSRKLSSLQDSCTNKENHNLNLNSNDDSMFAPKTDTFSNTPCHPLIDGNFKDVKPNDFENKSLLTHVTKDAARFLEEKSNQKLAADDENDDQTNIDNTFNFQSKQACSIFQESSCRFQTPTNIKGQFSQNPSSSSISSSSKTSSSSSTSLSSSSSFPLRSALMADEASWTITSSPKESLKKKDMPLSANVSFFLSFFYTLYHDSMTARIFC